MLKKSKSYYNSLDIVQYPTPSFSSFLLFNLYIFLIPILLATSFSLHTLTEMHFLHGRASVCRPSLGGKSPIGPTITNYLHAN